MCVYICISKKYNCGMTFFYSFTLLCYLKGKVPGIEWGRGKGGAGQSDAFHMSVHSLGGCNSHGIGRPVRILRPNPGLHVGGIGKRI